METCFSSTRTKLTLSLESPKVGDNDVSGYFSDVDNEIVVGLNDSWIEVLVHEFCHYQQYQEDCSCWVNLDCSVGNSIDLMWRWMDREIELKEKEIKLIFKRVQSMELDCERRTVKMIKKYKLPIDLDNYIREANLYMYFYNYAARNRQWFPKHVGPNSFKRLYEYMPKDLAGARNVMPELYYEIMGSYINCN